MDDVLVSADTLGATTYTHTSSLVAGQQYKFNVSSVNGRGEGA